MQNDANSNLVKVDLSASTGAVRHGASGFLYGLGNAGIPSANMLAPLHPQVAAQKPEGGLQHPNGDALDVAATYRAAGGREIQIYLQDAYANWPYEQLGLEDYLPRVAAILRQAMASPERAIFSLVPFNEPDQIWYNLGERRQVLLDDWNETVRFIKAIDPGIRIVGPNFARYDSRFYRDFLFSAREAGCLPDVISWHELSDEFFGGWTARLEDYRASERELGIAPREICINEYARIQGDLGNPGKLIQWVARFENSKVDGCLAYWTDAGSLNNLVTRDNYNRATGCWWLYKWYGDLTGDTLQVTLPAPLAEGLQALACLDSAKQQARVLLGGCDGSVDLRLSGLETALYFGNKVHAALWEAAFTGLSACGAPPLAWEGELPVVDGQVGLHLPGLVSSSAYQVIFTRADGQTDAGPSGRYPAVYAEFTGAGWISYGPEAVCITNSRDINTMGLGFVVSVEENAFYNLRLRYAAIPAQGDSSQALRLTLNGAPLTDFSLPATGDWENWAEAGISIFLTAGINRVGLEILPGVGLCLMRIAWLDLTPGSGWMAAYEAAAEGNSLSGTACVEEDGKFVGHIGGGAGNALQFNQVSVPEGGTYRMVVSYANAEFRGGHTYNSQVVDRWAEIRLNGGAAQKVYFRNTFAWDNYQTRVVDVDLRAGDNTIQFCNPSSEGYAPHIDKIEIAARLGIK